MPKSPVAALYAAVNKKSPTSALELVRENPEVAAAVSKLVRGMDPNKYFDKNKPNSFYNLDQGQLAQISASSKERVADSENMLQLFPDLELAQQILVSSIMSPKDMVKSDLIYTASESILPPEIMAKLIDEVKTYMAKEYDFEKLPPIMLENALFKEGADIRAILPESSIDEIINRNAALGMESFSQGFKEKLTDLSLDGKSIRQLGILGSGSESKPSSFESLALEDFGRNKQVNVQNYHPYLNYGVEQLDDNTLTKLVEVTDNFNILKLPSLVQKSNQARISSIIGKNRYRIGNEAYGSDVKPIMTQDQTEALIFKGRKIDARPFVAVRTQDTTTRRSIGKPLVMKLPTESIIPIHVPGQPENHIGYFLLVDLEGNPVTRSTNLAHVEGLQQRLNDQTTSMASFLLTKARRNLQANDLRNITVDQAARVYSDIVESDLVDRLRNGLVGGNVKIGNNEEVYRIMLARTFANQYTRLVYIPGELVVYTAFKYYDNGIGKSLLDDLKVLTSIRAILLFARIMAMTKNSIAITHVDMELDPNDPDPVKTAEMAVSEIIKMRQQYFPLGINSPVDLVDWVQRAGFEFTFTGHPGLPNTKFNFETKQLQHNVPDNELDESLRKQTFMALGLSPEQVDQGYNAEFATTIVQNNLLLSKRVVGYQDKFKPSLTDFVRKVIRNDNTARRHLLEILQTSKGDIEKFMDTDVQKQMSENPDGFLDIILEEFLDVLEISLPSPDITTIENQTTAYKQYAESITEAISAWVDTSFFTADTSGTAAELIDLVKAAYIAYYLRKWQADNNYLPELSMITEVDKDGKICHDLYDIVKDHTDAVNRATVTFVKSISTMKEAANKDLQEMDVQGGGGITSTSDSGGGDDGGFGMDFGGGGGDDFGMDLGGGDTGDTTGDETGSTDDISGTDTTTETPPEEDETQKDTDKTSGTTEPGA